MASPNSNEDITMTSAIRRSLEESGVWEQLKAGVRTEVLRELNKHSVPRPQLSQENFLINELIREYLEWNQYKHTASVLCIETGCSETPIDPNFLAEELNVKHSETSKKVVPTCEENLKHKEFESSEGEANEFRKFGKIKEKRN